MLIKKEKNTLFRLKKDEEKKIESAIYFRS